MARPLKVALVVKNKPAALLRDNRGMGQWSYAIPEFTWEHITPGKHFKLDTRSLKEQGFDLVFHEDGGAWGEYLHRTLPIVYHSIDSTLSDDNHFSPRLTQAAQADLVLVEHDRLERFNVLPVPVLRWRYCVNDRIFRDWKLDKDIDVAFHCNSGHAMPDVRRSSIRRQLHDLSETHKWKYSSGTLGVDEYARRLNRAKVVVNWPRVPANRPHRVYDALASRAALLTGPLPAVSDEWIVKGQHYTVFWDEPMLAFGVEWLLKDKNWLVMAERGYQWAKYQTWSARGKELREIVNQVFGL